ncbi:MAG: stage IV sporulation protein A [Oscillospiraceae bacterium]|nr:stage IV sporulation protein A [Oscillospiraceae bacterium]
MKLYEAMEQRTGGNVYLGVTGPVRAGKSTFVKRMMEELVLPNIQDPYSLERARDELPQSGSGRTIMTAEPKFVPENAVEICPDGHTKLSVRIIDSVGYVIPGAIGAMENGEPRMVTTPWFEHEIPMTEAAELGTKKVMSDHCTVGLVVTTDGSVTDLPREDYVQAEAQAIRDMQETGKPFLVLLNSKTPDAPDTQALAKSIEESTQARVLAADLLKLEKTKITAILTELLGQFPPASLEFWFPSWFDALEANHPCKKEIYQTLREASPVVDRVGNAQLLSQKLEQLSCVRSCTVTETDLGCGAVRYCVRLPDELFYRILSERSGVEMENDGDLLRMLSSYSAVRGEYERLRAALEQVRSTGYGVVMPTRSELQLQSPELVKKGGAWGVRLRAGAPSIHLIRTDLDAELSPTVGSEQQARELMERLTARGAEETEAVWESNLFGKSLYELVNERLNAKLTDLPEEVRMKLRRALERIVNEGANGLICLVL